MYAKTFSFVAFYWACLVVLTNAMAIEPKYKATVKRQMTFSPDVKRNCAFCMYCMTTVADWRADLENKCMTGREGFCEESRCPLDVFQNFDEFTDLSVLWMSHHVARLPEGMISPMATRFQIFARYQFEAFTAESPDKDVNIYEALEHMND